MSNTDNIPGWLPGSLAPIPYAATAPRPLDAITERLAEIDRMPSEVLPGYATVVSIKEEDAEQITVEVKLVASLEFSYLSTAIFRGHFTADDNGQTQKTGTISYSLSSVKIMLIFIVGITAFILLTADPGDRAYRFTMMGIVILTTVFVAVRGHRGSRDHLRQIMDTIE
jgi:hypothetical protein